MMEVMCDDGGHVMMVMYVHLCILTCSPSHSLVPRPQTKGGG